MKSTGIVRNVDELGRVVIPKELRRSLKIKDRDPIEIFVDENKIILQKYQSANECLITGTIKPNNVTLAEGKLTLSEEGIDQLLEEIKSKTDKTI